MAGPKRINLSKALDELCAEQANGTPYTNGVQLLRTMMRVALDDKHDQYGQQSRFLIDHQLGRATQKVEVIAPQGIQLDMSGAACVMMGVRAVTGSFTDANGETHEITVRPETETDE